MPLKHNRSYLRTYIELFVFLALICLYVVLSKQIAGKPYFIIPVIVLLVLFIKWEIGTDKRVLLEYGIRTDNLQEATELSIHYFVPMFNIIIGMFFYTTNPSPPSYFYFTILLYPLWGLAQQFLFQSFFHSRLIKLGYTPFTTIALSTLVYTFVHLNDLQLLPLTFIVGIFFSRAFYLQRNILPLGVAHGILGAMIYYLWLGKDPLKKFFQGHNDLL